MVATMQPILRPASIAGALLIIVGVSACGGAGTAASPAATPSSRPASPTPSATPEPVDVAAAFVEKQAGSLTFFSELTGRIQVGDVEGDVSGHLRVVGRDVHNLTVMTFPGLPPQETETITVGGTTYARTAEGYWLVASGACAGGGAAAPDPVTAALADADDLEVVGTEEVDGATLHRIESTSAPDIAPAAFGITDPSVTDFDAEVAFLAEDDGTPAGVILTASWTQGTAGEPVRAELEMRYLAVDETAEIEAPDDVWTVYESAELGYRMAHPVDWDVTHEPATEEFDARDLYVGPVDGELQVYRYTDLGGAGANMWFRASADLLLETFGVEPVVVNTLTLSDGAEVQIFALNYTDQADEVFFQQAVVHGGDVAWDLDWYSLAGNEDADQALLLRFVNSFQRATE